MQSGSMMLELMPDSQHHGPWTQSLSSSKCKQLIKGKDALTVFEVPGSSPRLWDELSVSCKSVSSAHKVTAQAPELQSVTHTLIS